MEKREFFDTGTALQDLANNASFLEVAFLLLKGHLPNKKEYENYADLIRMHTLVNEDVKHVFQVSQWISSNGSAHDDDVDDVSILPGFFKSASQ